MKTLLLDSSDLINLLDYDLPLPLEEARKILLDRNARLAICPIHFQEIAAPLVVSSPRSERSATRSLNRLERLPLAYYLDPRWLASKELLQALRTFEQGTRVSRVEPEVKSFADTIIPISEMTRLSDEDPLLVERLRRMDLAKIAFELSLIRPNLLQPPPAQPLPWIERTERQELRDTMVEYLDVDPDSAMLSELLPWLRENSEACPGFWLWFRARREKARDRGSKWKGSDQGDLELLQLFPYVDAATADKRWREYLRRTKSHYRVFKHTGDALKWLAD